MITFKLDTILHLGLRFGNPWCKARVWSWVMGREGCLIWNLGMSHMEYVPTYPTFGLNCMVNVGEYTIYGSYGSWCLCYILFGGAKTYWDLYCFSNKWICMDIRWTVLFALGIQSIGNFWMGQLSENQAEWNDCGANRRIVLKKKRYNRYIVHSPWKSMPIEDESNKSPFFGYK